MIETEMSINGEICTRAHADPPREICGYLSSIVEAAALMGRKGGRAKSDRKTMAVRKNGALGGRPKGERHEITAVD